MLNKINPRLSNEEVRQLQMFLAGNVVSHRVENTILEVAATKDTFTVPRDIQDIIQREQAMGARAALLSLFDLIKIDIDTTIKNNNPSNNE